MVLIEAAKVHGNPRCIRLESFQEALHFDFARDGRESGLAHPCVVLAVRLTFLKWCGEPPQISQPCEENKDQAHVDGSQLSQYSPDVSYLLLWTCMSYRTEAMLWLWYDEKC